MLSKTLRYLCTLSPGLVTCDPGVGHHKETIRLLERNKRQLYMHHFLHEFIQLVKNCRFKWVQKSTGNSIDTYNLLKMYIVLYLDTRQTCNMYFCIYIIAEN